MKRVLACAVVPTAAFLVFLVPQSAHAATAAVTTSMATAGTSAVTPNALIDCYYDSGVRGKHNGKWGTYYTEWCYNTQTFQWVIVGGYWDYDGSCSGTPATRNSAAGVSPDC